MNALIACEESQAITKEFRKLGHEAYSCDLNPCSGGHSEWHIQDDVFNHLDDGWDLMIAHPPCTTLTVAQAWTFKRPDRYPNRHEERARAIEFAEKLWNACIPRIAIENPVGFLSTMSTLGKPTQMIQPWQFGEDASKGTCLWLKYLKYLIPTDILEPSSYGCKCGHRYSYSLGLYGCPNCSGDSGPAKGIYANQNPSGQNKLGPSGKRAELRAKTYLGIARAMASQWG